MRKIMKILLLLIFISTVSVNMASSRVGGIITQIRKDYAETNAEKNYKIKREMSSYVFPVDYYIKDEIVKKIVINYTSEGHMKHSLELYFKNQKVYFAINTLSENHEGPINPEMTRFYFDKNGTIVRYIDSNGKIIENKTKLKEKLEEWSWHWRDSIGEISDKKLSLPF